MPDYKDQIPDYLDGHLTAEEMAAFNAQLEKDAALRQALEDYQAIRQTLGNAKLTEFQRKLELAKATTVKKKDRARPGWQVWVLAVVVLLLIAVGIWAVSELSVPAPEQVIAAHFQEFEPSYILPPDNPKRTTEEDTAAQLPPLSAARAAFSEQDYDRALELMQDVPMPERGDAYYYERGVLHLLVEQPTAAVEALRQSDSSFEGGRYWYAAIALLKSGERAQGKEQLEMLLRDTSSITFWQDKAEAMLRTLE